MKLWGGRFKKGTDKLVNDFNSSINVDQRMYREDIEGSLAHASMLGKQNIIPKEASDRIASGLLEILKRIDSGAIEIDETSEDIHSFVEGTLTYYIGEYGKMLHTGRSRNDQVTLDLRLHLKKAIIALKGDLLALEEVLLEKAKENIDTIMPGYTHMQKAQPITFAHHILAYAEMFKRDMGRLTDCYTRVDEMPLGSGALATSTYPIDREAVARDLGFSKITLNSLDSVSDRDYVIETLSCLSIIMMHLSRFSEEIILWCTNEFSFIELDDGYSTGSSIMPQKKNPDAAELIRGKTGRVYGGLMSLLTTMKGIPLAYNKDMQEDKEQFFNSLDTVLSCLKIMSGMLSSLKIKKENTFNAVKKGFLNATEAADYLVNKGMPFRDAHKVIGEIVLYCEEKDKAIEDISLEELKNFSGFFGEDVYEFIDYNNTLGRGIKKELK